MQDWQGGYISGNLRDQEIQSLCRVITLFCRKSSLYFPPLFYVVCNKQLKRNCLHLGCMSWLDSSAVFIQLYIVWSFLMFMSKIRSRIKQPKNKKPVNTCNHCSELSGKSTVYINIKISNMSWSSTIPTIIQKVYIPHKKSYFYEGSC